MDSQLETSLDRRCPTRMGIEEMSFNKNQKRSSGSSVIITDSPPSNCYHGAFHVYFICFSSTAQCMHTSQSHSDKTYELKCVTFRNMKIFLLVKQIFFTFY